MQYRAIQNSTIQYNEDRQTQTVQDSTVQYSTIEYMYNTVQYNTIQYRQTFCSLYLNTKYLCVYGWVCLWYTFVHIVHYNYTLSTCEWMCVWMCVFCVRWQSCKSTTLEMQWVHFAKDELTHISNQMQPCDTDHVQNKITAGSFFITSRLGKVNAVPLHLQHRCNAALITHMYMYTYRCLVVSEWVCCLVQI